MLLFFWPPLHFIPLPTTSPVGHGYDPRGVAGGTAPVAPPPAILTPPPLAIDLNTKLSFNSSGLIALNIVQIEKMKTSPIITLFIVPLPSCFKLDMSVVKYCIPPYIK